MGVWFRLYAARWAQIQGAKRVIGIDCVPERLALARNAFKIEVLDRLAHSFSDVTVTSCLISALVDVVIFVVPPPTDEDLHNMGRSGCQL